MNAVGLFKNPYVKKSNPFYTTENKTQKQCGMTSYSRQTEKANTNSFFDSYMSNMQKYSELLRTQRTKAKDVSGKLKKLKYHYKDISSKIMRSKTSAMARQVVSQAKREVLRLKREKQSGKYDSEEIDAAIVHAKAMERIARKKVKHLEEEEMAKACGGLCADSQISDERTEEEQEKDRTSIDELEREELQHEDIQQEEFQQEELLTEQTIEPITISEMNASVLEDLSQELFHEMSEELQNLMSELGIDELNDSLLAAKRDMDPADLKEMKIKHRNREMKEIVKADNEYLKAYFKYLEKQDSTTVMNNTFGSTYESPCESINPNGMVCEMPSAVIDVLL
ncbi:MAG: hypothetical protein PUE95_11930 [Lachnospiraceae bacterium]|nr:hypothetical protein [Lachnospiraceae bacterium]